jgi:hypothetical protein
VSVDDPFADSDKTPSLSLKDVPVGGTVTINVTAKPNLAQQRDFETGQPATWPDSGDAKMAVVINGTVNGDERALWCPKPSALFAAVGKAQSEAGALIDAGGVLTLKRLADQPAKNPRFTRKDWAAKYEVPAVDAFGDDDEPPF